MLQEGWSIFEIFVDTHDLLSNQNFAHLSNEWVNFTPWFKLYT